MFYTAVHLPTEQACEPLNPISLYLPLQVRYIVLLNIFQNVDLVLTEEKNNYKD